MRSTDPRVLAFIRSLREECRAAGVRIIFKNVAKLRDWDDRNRKTLDGYFSSPHKKKPGCIVVAAKVPLPKLLHTLAHEYVHFLQWRAKKPSFYTWSYLAHEKITEKSAIRLLEEQNLPINLRVRRKKSRAYIKKLKTDAI
jgi:Zn-dependent peptidase ImmA (M78 family)